MGITAWAWVLGLALGVRHALEPDHLAAVGTILARQTGTPRGVRGGALLGAAWGVGHSAGLLGMGVLLGLLEARLPERVTSALELAVAVMLCALGVSSLRQSTASPGDGPDAPHHHGGALHRHPSAGDHVHVRGRVLLRRPLMVGLMHGLAGSGALLALVVAQLPTAAQQLAYVGAFGLGSVMGMAALTGLAGWGLQKAALRGDTWRHTQRISGVVSVVVGLEWGREALGALGF